MSARHFPCVTSKASNSPAKHCGHFHPRDEPRSQAAEGSRSGLRSAELGLEPASLPPAAPQPHSPALAVDLGSREVRG